MQNNINQKTARDPSSVIQASGSRTNMPDIRTAPQSRLTFGNDHKKRTNDTGTLHLISEIKRVLNISCRIGEYRELPFGPAFCSLALVAHVSLTIFKVKTA